MIKYTRQSNGLKDFASQVAYIDTDQVSKNYFRLSGFPDRLYVGKNSFRISGNNDTLVVGSRIYIDVIDSNGNIIYHEVLNVSNRDKSKLVVIHVYEDTPPGEVSVYIGGRVDTDPRTGNRIPVIDDPFSSNNRSYPNIIWIGKSSVVQGVPNPSEIFFSQEPKIVFSEKFVSYSEVSGSVRLLELSGSGAVTLSTTSRLLPKQFSDKSVFTDELVEEGNKITGFPDVVGNVGESRGSRKIPEHTRLSQIKSSGAVFTKSMAGGIIKVMNLSVDQSLPSDVASIDAVPDYSASIVRVINSTTIEVDKPFNVARRYISTGGLKKEIIFNSFTREDNYIISYYSDDVNITTTDSSESFATLEFRGMEPAAGQIDRISVSYKPVGSYGEFINIGEFPIKESNFLVDSNVYGLTRNDGLREKEIGFPNSGADVAMYWTASGVSVAGVSASFNESNVIQAIRVSHGGISTSDKYAILTPTDLPSTQLLSAENSEYKLSFSTYYTGDTAGTSSWSPPYVDVYISGSGLITDQKKGGGGGVPVRNTSLGTYIGTIDSKQGRQQDNEFYFITRERKYIKPVFVIRSGVWDIGKIKIAPRKKLGFTPNHVKFSIPLNDLRQRSELIMDFKYLNTGGVPSNIGSRIYGVYFEGATNLLSQSVTERIEVLEQSRYGGVTVTYIGNLIGVGSRPKLLSTVAMPTRCSIEHAFCFISSSASWDTVTFFVTTGSLYESHDPRNGGEYDPGKAVGRFSIVSSSLLNFTSSVVDTSMWKPIGRSTTEFVRIFASASGTNIPDDNARTTFGLVLRKS